MHTYSKLSKLCIQQRCYVIDKNWEGVYLQNQKPTEEQTLAIQREEKLAFTTFCFKEIISVQRILIIMASELKQFYRSIMDNGIVDIDVQQQAINVGVHEAKFVQVPQCCIKGMSHEVPQIALISQ